MLQAQLWSPIRLSYSDCVRALADSGKWLSKAALHYALPRLDFDKASDRIERWKEEGGRKHVSIYKFTESVTQRLLREDVRKG